MLLKSMEINIVQSPCIDLCSTGMFLCMGFSYEIVKKSMHRIVFNRKVFR